MMQSFSCDICVVGGGMAGVCAAVAAARRGVSVALVQDRAVLGGNASSEIRMHVCGADTPNPVWRETGLLEEVRLKSLAYNREHNVSQQDLALYDTARSQPGLQLFLNTRVTGCAVDGRRVVSCEAEELTSERRFTIAAKEFIDASGDGLLAFAAGAAFRKGREGRDEHGESFAPETADDCTLGHTILFQIKDVGRPVPFTAPSWALKFTDADLPFRAHDAVYGYWWVEWGGTLDTINDTEAIKDELLAAAMGVWNHMKNGGDHGYANYRLEWLGFLPAKRESRRFLGDYIMTQQDLMEGRQFPDQIAYGGWPIDTHPPLGFRSPEHPCSQTYLKQPYGIPLRACYCRDFDNLFLAGRNISATHIAFASTRVMSTCAVIGEGVGEAAACAARHSATAREVAEHHIIEVQQALLANGAFLLDIANADPADLARQAAVTSSGDEGVAWAADKVIDGINHPTPDDAHGWRSDAAHGMPAWLELRWPAPVTIARVQAILDTDFSKRLLMSQDPAVQKLVAPTPRAVTLKHFTIEVEDGGAWREVAEVSGNMQRLACVDFPPVETSALRLVAREAWDVPYASVLEVRCYGSAGVPPVPGL